jgi:uroporphyrin-III C-methyltransferase
MGMSRLADVQAGLLQALPPGTPAAIVQHAGSPLQKHGVTTLGSLEHCKQQHGLGSPAIVLVGDVLRGLAAAAAAPAARAQAA